MNVPTSPRLLSALLLATCLTGAGLAGCVPDDPDPTVPPPTPGATPDFAGASAAVHARAISAAAGHDARIALELAAQLPRYPDGGCPRVSSSPEGTVFEGGCDLVRGGRVEGRAVIDLGGPDRPTVLRFDRFGLDTAAGQLWFDGTVVRTPDSLRVQVDLAAVLDGLHAESRLSLDCATDLCIPGPGAIIDVETLGEATVQGVWSDDGEPVGFLRLTARDGLRVDFEGRCSTYRIDNVAAGTYCVPTAPSVAIANELFARYACVGGRGVVVAQSRYPYPSVVHRRVRGTVIGVSGPIELSEEVVTLEPLTSFAPAGFAWRGDLGACDEIALRGRVVDAVVDDQRVARVRLD